MNSSFPPPPPGSFGQTPRQEPGRWEQSTLEKLLMQAYRQQRREFIGRWVWRFVLIGLFLLLLFAGAADQDLKKLKAPHTAVVQLNGVIGAEGETDAVLLKGLKEAYKNPQVKGIVIRANSPGGSPVVSDVAFTEIRRLKAEHPQVPVIVVAEDLCASGCYYIASAADKIYANPSSIVGSIGVISSGFGFTGLMDKLGIERRVKTAGSNKDMGDPFVPETPEQKAIWQGMLDEIHKNFVDAVKSGRGNRLHADGNPDLFSGRVYTGTQAKAVGLIDDFGNVYTVAREVVKAPELVDYTPKPDFAQSLSRRFGTEMKHGLQMLSQPGW